MYRLPRDTAMSIALMEKYISDDAGTVKRLDKLDSYYVGKHQITRRTSDSGKPNNRIVNPYANYITDIMVGYFMGDPVAYSTDYIPPAKKSLIQVIRSRISGKSDGNALLDKLKGINAYNDEAAHNATLATDLSKYGRAFEVLYYDRYGEIRFRRLDPIGVIPIYDDTLDEELLYVIRYYDQINILDGSTVRYVDVYGASEIVHYRRDDGIWSAIGEPEINAIGMVPVNCYYNNLAQLGDYELVISLIDAYDKAQSDSVNDLEYFADAYLLMTGLGDNEENDSEVQKMKKNRVIILPEGCDAKWLVKDINDTFVENLKTRLDAAIHKFAKCPAMTDQDFSQNSSGVAMKYKLFGTENAASSKERLFRQGLQRRIELICAALAVKGFSYDWRTITMSFSRNVPANLAEMAEIVSKVGDLLSDETKIGLLPVDVDYQSEQIRKAQETEAGYSIPTGDDDPDGGDDA